MSTSESKRSPLSYLILTLKGMGMGAADVVPGVSGGTIAFITGIYEELIYTIKSINLQSLKILFAKGPFAFYKAINGGFLISIFSGILISAFSLSKLLTYLMDFHPVLLWSFFFGLIIASVFLIKKQVSDWNTPVVMSLVLGIVIAYLITIATPSQIPEGHIFIFLSGFVAIIAMILPGISGAFILLLLGAYPLIISTINDLRASLFAGDIDGIIMNGLNLSVFAVGCLLGLLSFSRVLSWMFAHHKNVTLSLLMGFMIGSLNKIWPWKTTVSSRIAHAGSDHEEIVPFIQKNVLPNNFSQINDVELGLTNVPNKDPQLLYCILLMLLGYGLIVILERFGPKQLN